ncbi:Protein argonaute-3 [Labeo rohita]|uniref:Protein argonaute-3 n=1 Tax=Labeo rohita TaxID=84645 RepID=A0ABQ8MGP9_LABRO|nr:Protein argonaute-3 [Labeo rohita]
MNQLYILLLALWSACSKWNSYSPDGRYWNYPTTPAPTTSSSLCRYWYNRPCNWATNGHHSDVPVPSITVFRKMGDGEHVIVMCSFGRRLIESSFQLSLTSEYNSALMNPQCFSNNVCVFDVNVSSPVSLTCVHQINSVVNRQSVTYTYSPPDFVAGPHCSDHHDGGVSSFYIGFFSFIVVGLFIMIVAVIMATIKSKAKGVCFTQTTHFHV